MKIRFLVVFMLLVGLWTFSLYADDIDSVRQRAECAQMEMEKALGHKVDPEAWNACKSVPDALEAHKQELKAREDFSDAQPPAVPSVQTHPGKPAWVDTPPRKNGILYGVGSGPNAQTAFNNALVMIAAQLQVRIRASISSIQAQSTNELWKNGRLARSRTYVDSYVQNTSRMIVSGNLKHVKLLDQWVNPKDKTTWVLASLDVAAIERQKAALVKAVFDALRNATLRLNRQIREKGVLDQKMLWDLIDVIGDVRALGKSDIGRQVKSKWERAFRRFSMNVRDLVECVEVQGEFVLPSGSQVPLRDRPRLPADSRIELQVTCHRIPIANARFRMNVLAGLVQVPQTVNSDGKGHVSIRVGTSFGSGIRLGLTHDMKARPGAYWLKRLKPIRRGMVQFGAVKPATISFDVSGGTAKENSFFAKELAAYARRKWGTRVVSGNPMLKAKVRLHFDTVSEVGSKAMQPLAVDISIVLAGQDGVLLSKTVKTGYLAKNRKKARAGALKNLVRTIGRLKIAGILETSVKVK